MVVSRWLQRVGPVLAALGAVVVVASTTAGAPTTWVPPLCDGPPGPGQVASGAWYRLDPTIEDGVRTGQRLWLGRAEADEPRHVDLDPESFASGPFGGTVLVGTDDGRSSRLSLVDLVAGCAWQLGASAGVVRHATLTPDGRSVVEFRVDRRTRSDLGVWSRPLDGDPASRLLGAIEPDPRFGPTWTTELGWSDDGRTLLVESCGEVACRYRLVEPASGATDLVAEPALGDLVGLADGRLVARGACLGLPCPLLAMPRGGGEPVILDADAGQAVLTRGADGRSLVVHELDADGRAVRAVRPDGRDGGPVDVPVDGRRLVGPAAWSGGALETADGWVPFAIDGRLPLGDGRTTLLRRVDEVPR
jgi:hypothetical protein